MTSSPSLPTLLSALALGARSVSSLPLHNDTNDDDEYAFRMSLPEFSSLNYQAQSLLASLLRLALYEEGGSLNSEEGDLEDPQLWEKCANACEALLDSVSEYLTGDKKEVVGSVVEMARERAEGNYGRMLRCVVDMEKPQNVYQGFVTHPPQNSRNEPFIPIIAFDTQKQMMLDSGALNRDGNGLDTRYQNKVGNNASLFDDNNEIDGPSYHIEHPYREEIEELEYQPWQFDLSKVDTTKEIKISNDQGVWIGTEEDLAQLAKRIVDEDICEIAIDLEAHSHRTFAGFVCLIQLSLRRDNDAKMKSDETNSQISTSHDFLIDALSLRHAISTSLGPILANPNILKVMHGADSDIPWLQRDFGCFVINLFDTGRASRALKFPSAGLAYLLRKYVKFEADKSHQLADWRRRPLPEDMRVYAVSDTRYLLDIYDKLRCELENHAEKDVSIKSVLDRSKDVCLIRYDKEPFRPMGYKFIMDGRRGRGKNSKQALAPFLKGRHEVTSDLSEEQEAALKALFDWRDRTARQEDESVQYVCPNAALLRIASNRPVTVAALQRLVNPPPPLVLRRSQEILELLTASKAVSSTSSGDVPKSSLAAAAVKSKKPITVDTLPPPTPSRNREMLSPILGSEMLYEKAGWKSPPHEGNITSESEDESKRRFLDVGDANKGYSSSQLSSHSLKMSPLNFHNDATNSDDLKKGQKSAQLIHNEMTKSYVDGAKSQIIHGFDVMQYIRPYAFKEKEDNILRDESTTPNTYENITDVDDMAIPKSMSEIYQLSNVNRRRANKDKLPKAPNKMVDGLNAEKLPEDDIEEAEKILASRGSKGGGYFGDNKRQKPNNIPPGKEGDIELMIKMGWVKNKEEADALATTAATSDEEEDQKKGDSKKILEGGKGSSGSSDYYSTMGAGVGAFDPNAPPSSNPFFQGAAAGAASLFTSDQKNAKSAKSGKRNKKR